jgi:hypothetical protein
MEQDHYLFGINIDHIGDKQIIDSVIKAKNDWLAAQNYFDNVSDPDLVDYAIYEMEASRKKYMYLLKQAKNIGNASGTHQFLPE